MMDVLQETKVRASLQKLAAAFGPEVLSLPINTVPHKRGMPRAWTDPNGIWLSEKAIARQPDKIHIFLAHEIMHPVVDDPEATNRFSHWVVNTATDFKINQILKYEFGFNIMETHGGGLLNRRYYDWTIIQIAEHYAKRKRKKHLHCNMGRVAHPTILRIAARLRAKLQGKYGLRLQPDYFYMDKLDNEAFYDALSGIRSKIKAPNIPALDLVRTVKGIWGHIYLEKAVALPVLSKKLTAGQTLAYALAGKDYRQFQNDPVKAMLAAVTFLRTVDSEPYWLTDKRVATSIRLKLAKFRLSEKLNHPDNNYLAPVEVLEKRVANLRLARRRWQRMKPLPDLLLHTPIKVLSPNPRPDPVPRPALRVDPPGREEALSYRKQVKVPIYHTRNRLIKQLRAASRRAFRDTFKTIEAREDMDKLFKEFPIDEEQPKLPPELTGGPVADEEPETDTPEPDVFDPNNEETEAGEEPDAKNKPAPGTSGGGDDPGSNRREVKVLDFISDNIDILTDILFYMKEIGTMLEGTARKQAGEDGQIMRTYTYGNDLTRVVPSEFALLASDENLKLKFLADYASHSLLQVAPADPRRYPVVVAVDGSGSMMGRPYAIAVGFAMALIRKLAQDKRGAALMVFSDKVGKWIIVDPKYPVSLLQLLKTVSKPAFGGGNFDDPIRQAFDIRDAMGWPSVAVQIVSDGYENVHNPEVMRKRKRPNDKIMVAVTSKVTRIQGVDEVFNIQKSNMQLSLVKMAKGVL